MQLVDIPKYEGFAPGYTDTEEEKLYHLEKAVRIFPHKMAGEGHFVALLKKSEDSPTVYHNELPAYKGKLPKELDEFLDSLTMPIDKKDIFIDDTRVYLLPRCAGDLKGLRKLRTGLLMGELKKDRFEPSQALAMALRSDEYPYIVNLSVNDDNVIKYLKGETIEVDEKYSGKGWCLICVDGYSLGWGKISGTTIKNKYLAGWRWM